MNPRDLRVGDVLYAVYDERHRPLALMGDRLICSDSHTIVPVGTSLLVLTEAHLPEDPRDRHIWEGAEVVIVDLMVNGLVVSIASSAHHVWCQISSQPTSFDCSQEKE